MLFYDKNFVLTKNKEDQKFFILQTFSGIFQFSKLLNIVCDAVYNRYELLLRKLFLFIISLTQNSISVAQIEFYELMRNRTSQKSSVLLIIYWLIIEFDYLNEGDKLLKLLYSAGPRLSKQILYFLSNQESAQSKIRKHENVPMTS